MANLGWRFYIINASYNFIFLAAVYFLWPETKGQSLEDIALNFEPAEAVYGTDPYQDQGSDVVASSDLGDKSAGVRSTLQCVNPEKTA